MTDQAEYEANAIREEILDEIADLEEYARRGERPPHCRGYRIRINGERYEIMKSDPTGREILHLAGLVPPNNYTLRVKIGGEPPKKIGLDEKVDLRRPGVEKFKALPRDQQEGLDRRHQFFLPPDDEVFLNQYGVPWETIVDGSQWVLIHDFSTHERYNHQKVSVAIRLETGYPLAALDMVYVFPALIRNDGKPIRNADVNQALDGKVWQRWSRHRTSENPWKPGEDSIETHVYLIEDWFVREFER
jgi:hypothetical protein